MSNVERNLARGPKPGDARLEAMLRGISSLSTPAFLAARLMELYAGGAGSAEEMLRVARLDPALTAKLLANSEQTCLRNNNSAEAWHPWQPEAVRSAVPAMQTDCVPQELRAEFEALWRHSVAAALAAERIARELNSPGVDRREAYVCGLLHDLGKFAAWQAMPKSYARAVQEAGQSGAAIVQAERQTLGLDHAVIGRRLAELWRLPRQVVETIWLHHHPSAALPEAVDKTLVRVVALANALAHEITAGAENRGRFGTLCAELAGQLGLAAEAAERIGSELPEVVRSQCAGLETPPGGGDEAGYKRALSAANRELARVSEELGRRTAALEGQARAFELLRDFASGLGGSSLVGEVLPRVGTIIAAAAGVSPSPERKVLAYSVLPEIAELLCVAMDGGEAKWLTLARAPGPPPAAPSSPQSAMAAAGRLLRRGEELLEWIDAGSYIHRAVVCEGRWIGGVFLPSDNGGGCAVSEELQQAVAAGAGLALAMVQGRARAVLLGEQLAERERSSTRPRRR